MPNSRNIIESKNQHTELNARVVNHYKELDLEPLRELFDKMGPDSVVDDLTEMIELLNTLVYTPDKLEFNRAYLQDRMWAMNTLRKYFTDLERSTVKKVEVKFDPQALYKAS